MITQERLKELLRYDPNTGEFTRLKATSRSAEGSIAGSADTYGYLQIKIDRKLYLVHRLVFLYVHGGFPENHIDHINHARADNRISNLRCVSRQENLKNQAIYKNNSSGISGISWSKSRKRWASYINFDGNRNYLGYYLNINDAIIARKMAEYENGFHPNHGE